MVEFYSTTFKTLIFTLLNSFNCISDYVILDCVVLVPHVLFVFISREPLLLIA